MSKPKKTVQPEKNRKIPSSETEARPNIGTADDINVDEDNAIESPKESLTAVEHKKPRRQPDSDV